MTLRGMIGFATFYVLFVVYNRCAHAEQKIKVYVIAPSSADKVTREVGDPEMYDNLDKTSTLTFMACGSRIKIVIPNDMFKDKKNELEIEVLANELAQKACAGAK